ncbi:MAG: hypothetical protein RMM98_02485 [Acidobacteriota bacterium]|nr:hypothetical protein [Blastocatellia bacterium]MDW8238457.1 hypothetical protein [Acidobacteriota bacterium]
MNQDLTRTGRPCEQRNSKPESNDDMNRQTNSNDAGSSHQQINLVSWHAVGWRAGVTFIGSLLGDRVGV